MSGSSTRSTILRSLRRAAVRIRLYIWLLIGIKKHGLTLSMTYAILSRSREKLRHQSMKTILSLPDLSTMLTLLTVFLLLWSMLGIVVFIMKIQDMFAERRRKRQLDTEKRLAMMTGRSSHSYSNVYFPSGSKGKTLKG